MDNGFGGTNTIVYQPSTLYDNTLSGDDAPDLPFVTWVVAATRLTDGLCEDPDATDLYDPTENECIGKGHEIVTTFNYSGGLFDGSEREFRGFRNVYQTRVEALEDGIPIEGNVTLTQFHQDAERKGLIERVQEFAGSSTVVRLLVNNWETVTITVAPEKERMRLYQALDLTVVMDLGGLSGATLVLRGNSPPDSYGNVTHSYTQSTFYSSDPSAWRCRATRSGTVPSTTSTRSQAKRASIRASRCRRSRPGIPI
jgi:hypothetical protein